jgi:hypothetical protein
LTQAVGAHLALFALEREPPGSTRRTDHFAPPAPFEAMAPKGEVDRRYDASTEPGYNSLSVWTLEPAFITPANVAAGGSQVRI